VSKPGRNNNKGAKLFLAIKTKEHDMDRKDIVAAKVFVTALEPSTIEAMKRTLLHRAEQGEERPDPTTRLGLALIAFTTPDDEPPSLDEVRAARKRVASLWTEEERRSA